MLKYTILFAVVAGLVFAATPAIVSAGVSEVVPPDGGYPDVYRLIFVTSTTTDATSTDIGDYNAFANSAANDLDGNTGSLVAGLGVAWKCLGSTELVSAKVNTNTYAAGDVGYQAGNDVPIYNLAGQLMADTNAHLWDGELDNRVTYNEEGTAYDWNAEVWTGSSSAGVANRPLGSEVVTWTRAWDSGQYAKNWMAHDRGPSDELRHLYALSAPIPEPATLALLLLGAPLLTLRRRRA